ncbi:MAG: hypothetical protein AAFZ15_03385 [Bacteroidota bacterium]
MNQLPKKTIFISLFILFLITTLSTSLQAIIIIQSPCGSTDLPDGREGTTFGNYNVLLTLWDTDLEVEVAATSWSINNNVPFNNNTGGTWNINLVGTAGELRGSIGNSPLLTNPSIEISATYAGGAAPAVRTFFLNILPDELGEPDMIPCVQEFAFLFDKSGSMNGLTDAGPTKWARLLEVAQAQLGTLSSIDAIGLEDRKVIILFSGNDAESTQEGNFGSDLNIANDNGDPLDDAESVESNYTPGGATPLGGGILRALLDFFTPGSQPWIQKILVVFTDGIQNKNPMVADDGDELVLVAGRTPPGGIIPEFPAGDYPEELASHNLEMYAVGLGTMPGVHATLLDNLTSNNYEDADAGNLNNIFENFTEDALAPSGSPRILAVRRGQIPQQNQTIEEAFVVHDSILSLSLKIFAVTDEFIEPQVTLKKDGVTLQVDPYFQNDIMIMYHVKFPGSPTSPGGINSKGTWSLEFSDEKPIRYEVSAIVDEKNIKSRVDFNGVTDFYAGDDLPVRVRLRYKGAPIDTGVTVIARLLKPGEDLGDLIANTSADTSTFQPSEPQLTLGEVKFETLGQTQLIIDQISKVTSPDITLTNDGNGFYSGTFTGINVTGGSRVIVEMQGTNAQVGDYTGWKARTAVFDFARPDDIDLQEQLIDLGVNQEGERIYRLELTPVNRFNKKLGPAQESRIRVTPDNDLAEVGPLQDHLDGTYSTIITVPDGENFNASVYVIDFKNPVGDIKGGDQMGRVAFSLHLGGTLPFDSLDNLFNPSFMAEVDLTYRINQNFTAELVGGYYGFDPDHYILGGSLFGVYRFNLGGVWGTNLGLGPGVFKPKNEDLEWGAGLKGGISGILNNNWELGLQATYYTYALPDLDYRFGTGSLYLKYFF